MHGETIKMMNLVTFRAEFRCIISNNLLQVPIDSIRKYYRILFMVTLTFVILTLH